MERQPILGLGQEADKGSLEHPVTPPRSEEVLKKGNGGGPKGTDSTPQGADLEQPEQYDKVVLDFIN